MKELLQELLSWIPVKFRAFTGYVLIIISIIGLGIYFKILPNWFKNDELIVDKKCEFVSISGKLIDQNNKEINALGVNIEGMNLNEDNTAQGIFTLKGVKIPSDSLISFQITLADTAYFVKGFDLGNTLKYPINNCKIDVRTIRLNLKKLSSKVPKTYKQSYSKYNVNIKGDNKGKIIQGDKIIIVNDN